MSFLINPYIYAVTPSGCSGSIISTANLEAYYKLDGDGTDDSGNGYTLTNTGTVTYTPEAKYGSDSALFYTGGTNPATVTKSLHTLSAVLNTTASSSTGYSMSCWVRIENTTTAGSGYIFSWNSNAQRLVELKMITTGWRFTIYNGSTSNYDYAVVPANDTWIHVAMTMGSGGAFKVYIDDVVQISGTNAGDGSAGVALYGFGGLYYAASTFLGEIDDIAVFDRELSAAEVNTIYSTNCPIDTP